MVFGKSFAFLLLLAAGALAWSPKARAAGLRFDQIQQRFIHNAYGAERDGSVVGGLWIAVGGRKDEQLLDQLVHHRVRAIELDLHPDHPCGSGFSSEPEWFIYHDCFDTHSNVGRLSEALRQLRAFHDAQPRHEVVTVNLELGSLKAGKGDISAFDNSTLRSPETLDGLIRSQLGNAVFTPRELLTYAGEDVSTGSLHRAVTPKTMGGQSGWPTTDELRGKFIFLIHGVDADMDRYFGPDLASINQRVAFLLDEWRWNRDPVTGVGEDFPHIVFHSELPYAGGAALRSGLPGHILRSIQIDDGSLGQTTDALRRTNMEAAQRSGINYLFMDLVHVPDQPFIRTHNDFMYPFGASVRKPDGTFPVGAEAWQHAAVASKLEPGRLLLLGDKSGGDLDGGSDRFIFAFDPLAGAANGGLAEVWTAEVASTSNKSVHPHGKGFVMARQSTDPGAPYCAVGRTADRYGLRLQGRWHLGGGTAVHEFRSHDIYKENYNFVRLELTPQGDGSTRCRAYGAASAYDNSWEQIGPDVYVEGPLPLRGVATASNSGYNADNARTYSAGGYSVFEFVDLRRGGPATAPVPVVLDRLQPVGIGTTEAPYFLRLDGDPRLSLERNYSFGENMRVLFANLPGNALDWIAYVPEAASTWTHGDFEYTHGAVTGSVELLAPAPGRYRLRAHRNDGLEVVAESAPFDVAPTPATLAPSQPSYPAGETIEVHFSRLPGNATDWIALLAEGAVFTASSPWQYTAGATDGTVEFVGQHSPGRYRLVAFVKDTFVSLVESAPFEILPSVAALVSARESFTAGDVVTGNFSGFPGNARDWIALVPNCGSYAAGMPWQYTQGASAGGVQFAGAAPGTYCLQGFSNDTFSMLAQSQPFTVEP